MTKLLVRQFLGCSTKLRFASTLTSLRDEVLRFDSSHSVNSAHTPPGSWYSDTRFHDLDQSSVFAKNWVAVCGAHNLQKPGDYVTGFLGDEPYLIGKDVPDKIHYFYNVCRHHGTLLCDKPKGHTAEFVCPYHAWKYALDGRLTMAKRLRHIENFSARENSLKKFAGSNWFGCLFLNQDAAADEKELQERLDGLKERLGTLGCTEDNLIHVASHVFTINCNWKVTIDNYLDGGYHVPVCHRDLNDLLDEDSYRIELFDGYSIQSSDGVDSSSRVGLGTLFSHIYPNFFLNRYGNWLDTNYVLPTGPQTCEVVFDWYFDRDVYESLTEQQRAELIERGIDDSKKVQNEDIEICERVQKGMRSKSFTHGRYAPMLEHPMYDFHCRLAKDYDGTAL